MTEKRYMLDEGLIYDNGKEMEDVVDVLNEYAEENEQLKEQMQSILKLTKKIEDCTHDIKMIGDYE